MCPMGRDRRCLHGVGGIFISHILPIGNFILDLFFTSWYCSFTTNGKGEWRGNGPLKAGTGRRKPELGKRKPLGGEARDGRKRGEVKTIRAKKPPIEALYPELPARRPNKG